MRDRIGPLLDEGVRVTSRPYFQREGDPFPPLDLWKPLGKSLGKHPRHILGPVAAKEAELLVVTEDNKGIPMVRPVQEKPVGTHCKKGEKANKKQMACIGY